MSRNEPQLVEGFDARAQREFIEWLREQRDRFRSELSADTEKTSQGTAPVSEALRDVQKAGNASLTPRESEPLPGLKLPRRR